MRRTKLRPRSEKTARLYREVRIPFVVKMLGERPVCEICFSRGSTEVHERLSRGRSGGVRGDDWVDPENVLCLCHWCHRWVTDHPKEAEEHGWLLQSRK